MTPKEMHEMLGAPYLVYDIGALLEEGVSLDQIVRSIESNHPSYKYTGWTEEINYSTVAWFECR